MCVAALRYHYHQGIMYKPRFSSNTVLIFSILPWNTKNVWHIACLCFCFQDSKKFFKRAELAQKEKEDYFRRCGYKVHMKMPHSLTLSPSIFLAFKFFFDILKNHWNTNDCLSSVQFYLIWQSDIYTVEPFGSKNKVRFRFLGVH